MNARMGITVVAVLCIGVIGYFIATQNSGDVTGAGSENQPLPGAGTGNTSASIIDDTTTGTDSDTAAATGSSDDQLDSLLSRVRRHVAESDGTSETDGTSIDDAGDPGESTADSTTSSDATADAGTATDSTTSATDMATDDTGTDAAAPGDDAMARVDTDTGLDDTTTTSTTDERTGTSSLLGPPRLEDSPTDTGTRSTTTTSTTSSTTDTTATSSRTPADAPAVPATYTIQEGDTFTSLARQYYGSVSHWEAIALANPQVDPTRLRIGMSIKLPPRSEVVTESAATSTASTSVPPPPGPGSLHTVGEGESLWIIAEQHLGNGALWEKIYTTNRSVIGDDPGRLRQGMVLRIPPRD